MIKDLVAYYTGHFEGLLVSDRVDDHVAVDADEVLRIKNAVLVLQGSVSCAVTAASASQRLSMGGRLPGAALRGGQERKQKASCVPVRRYR